MGRFKRSFGSFGRLALASCLAACMVNSGWATTISNLQFEITLAKGVASTPIDGRLFLILSHQIATEPRLGLGEPGPDAPQAFARDVKQFAASQKAVIDVSCIGSPLQSTEAIPPGDYYVEAVLDWNKDLRSVNSPSNLCSKVTKLHIDLSEARTFELELSRVIPDSGPPQDTDEMRFLQIPSKLLSEFHGRPMMLRASVMLPKDFAKERWRQYPLWVCIGGFNTRYTSIVGLMSERSEFRKLWFAKDTPRVIMLQLDGDGPLGDPYYINSANSGPYGDALVQELIPYVESRFRGLGQPKARFLSGTSTGGWVSLALQIFYPDFFNGAWSSCPDPVDFRAFELINIYEDDNAYVNRYGNERPSERDLHGDVRLTMRGEVGIENLLGRGNSYTSSGQQWGAWTALYSPRGADGLPMPIWEPKTGVIDHSVAERWKSYDLRLYLEANWKTLAPKLKGKIHIASGEADQYFLNNAMHLLEKALAKLDPPFEGEIVFGPGKGHGWSNVSSREMLKKMQALADAP